MNFNAFFLETEKLRDSQKTEDRVLFVRIMNALLYIFEKWKTKDIERKIMIQELIKNYKDFIQNYKVYYYL